MIRGAEGHVSQIHLCLHDLSLVGLKGEGKDANEEVMCFCFSSSKKI